MTTPTATGRPTLAQRKTPRPCANCQKIFIPKLGARKGLYCSFLCRQGGTARATAEKRGNILRHRGLGLTYTKKNGRHEHRVVAEKIIGRPLHKGEIVHHINGDKKDNSPENLEVMTQSEHINRHREELLNARSL